MKIYANDNGGAWPTPPFDETRIGDIDYSVRPGSGQGSVRSPNWSQPSAPGLGNARQLSTTRAFWMLVRAGDVQPKCFICLTSGDIPDPTINIDAYYDFTGPKNVSYGFQVPFGPMPTRAGEWTDAEMPLAADRGPYTDARITVPPKTATTKPTAADGLAPWRPFNSPNHPGEGQNVLYGDGHVAFERLPTVGVDGDNIYTVALDTGDASGRVVGESPWLNSAHPLQRFDASGAALSATDSVIFP